MSQKCNITTDINHLSCTEKACDALHQPKSDLTLRERQLLMLMKTDSHFCDEDKSDKKSYCDACEKLVSKVDINGLVARGYLVFTDGYQPLSESNPSTNPVNTRQEADSILRFVAGNF